MLFLKNNMYLISTPPNNFGFYFVDAERIKSS